MPPPSAAELSARLPAGAAERFRGDLLAGFARAHDEGTAPDDPRWAVAVSGGPDSMAMLALTAAAFPGRLVAVTFDHRLRAGSDAEAVMVGEACQTLGVPHAVLAADAPIAGSSLQSRARAARYAALCRWAADEGLAALLTAHHADDQAETLLMRLNRGSGLAGLAGVRPWRFASGALILRPLLGWRRDELRAVVEATGLPCVADPANADPRHDRSRVRAALSALPELDPVRLARSALWLGEAEEVVALSAARLWEHRWCGPHRPFGIEDQPRELRRRLLRRAIHAAREALVIVLPPFTDASNVEPLLDALEAGRGATQAGVKVTPGADGWRFAAAPPRRSP